MKQGVLQDKTEIFESKPIPAAIAALAVPTILSQIITMVYNLADTFFVGHTGDPCQVAALTLVFPLFMLLTGVGNLCGIGANSLISRCLGVGDHKRATRASVFTLWGGLAATAVMLLLLGLRLDSILRLMGASDATIGPTKGYVLWVLLVGGIPTEASLLLAHMLRGEGSTRQASFGMMLGGILNMLLDPLFIYGFGMGVSGAGFATMLSNVVCLLFYICVLVRDKGQSVIAVDFRLFSVADAGEILLVGLPAALVIALGSSANILLTRLFSAYGDIPIAAFGVTQKFGTIMMNVTVGLTQGIMPLIGYNYAAGNSQRVRGVCRGSFMILLCFVAVLVALYQLIPAPLMRLFVSDSSTVELGAGFLRRWSLCVPGMTMIFLLNSIFQAMGMWKRSTLLSAIRQGVLFIPLMILLNRVMGMYGLVWSQPVADTLSLLLGFGLYVQLMKRSGLSNQS